MKIHLGQLLMAGLLAASVVPIAVAQDAQSPKQDIKNAGSDTKDAAKKTESASKKGTRKAVHKSAKKTKQGANAVGSYS